MTQIITVNELKTKGISILDEQIESGNDVIVSVRGKNKYVVLPMDKYNHLRECELEAALLQTKKELKESKYIKESVDKHLKRISRG